MVVCYSQNDLAFLLSLFCSSQTQEIGTLHTLFTLRVNCDGSLRINPDYISNKMLRLPDRLNFLAVFVSVELYRERCPPKSD